MTTARPQRRYDHRLREIVQRTGDLSIASDRGVPRSTARGSLRAAPTVVVGLDVANLTELELQQEVVKLRRRVQKLAALLRLALILLRTSGFTLSGERLPDGQDKLRILRAVDQARAAVLELDDRGVVAVSQTSLALPPLARQRHHRPTTRGVLRLPTDGLHRRGRELARDCTECPWRQPPSLPHHPSVDKGILAPFMGGSAMRRSRIVAFVVGMAYGLAASPAVCPTLVALGSQEPGVRQLDISGTVVRERSGSRVPGVRLQLRSLDTGLVVAQTVSDSNGAYSFAVPQPGRYGVEVVNDEGVIASSRAVTITDSPMTATVYLQDRRNTRALAGGVLAVLAAATAAGIASMVAGPAPVSPER